MAFSPAFLDLIAQPNAVRSYLVTVQPYAVVRASMAQVASGNRLTAAAGTFSTMKPWDTGLTLSRPATGDVTIGISDVADDGSWVQVTGVTLSNVAAATCTISGLVDRYFSTGGYNTTPTDTPANRHYEDGVENALSFTRTMYDGTKIGGRSIPGRGDIVLHNLNGRFDGYRSWGWAGRRVTVELGATSFARNEFGVIFVGVTAGVSLSDDRFSISVRDLTELLNQALYAPRYRGTGGYEGGIDLLDQVKPICIGKCQNIEPVPLGIIDGRFTYQFHDGAVAAYDSGWHQVRDAGVPLTYVASSPAAGQWTLDATRGLIIIGGGEPALLTADVIGTSDASTEPSAARAMEYLVLRRLALDSGGSITSVSIGTGSKTFTVRDTLPFGIGGYALISRTAAPDQYWMLGTVTGWTGGSLTVNVTASAGVGTFSDWTVTKIGLLASEIGPGTGGDVFDELHTANTAPVQVYIRDGANALDVLDEIAKSIGAFYGFDRAGLFDAGLFLAPTGTPVLSIDGDTAMEGLQREDTSAPAWRVSLGYGRNFRVATTDELAEDIRKNLVTNGYFNADTDWTKGTGWTISSGAAQAVAGSASDLSQTIALKVGQEYVLTADVTRSAGSVQFKLDSTNLGSAVSATGTLEVTFISTSASMSLKASKDSSFAGSVDNISIVTSRLRFFTTEYRYPAAAADMSVRTIYGPYATSETRDTLLLRKADAETEQARQLALYGAARDVFTVPAKTEPFQVDIGNVVELTDSRYGLSAGKLMTVLGIIEDASTNRVTLTLWG
jgi:hypothetical protein